jgi:hypothetical protein
VTPVVDHLSSKHKALSSNFGIAKNKKKKKKNIRNKKKNNNADKIEVFQ